MLPYYIEHTEDDDYIIDMHDLSFAKDIADVSQRASFDSVNACLKDSGIQMREPGYAQAMIYSVARHFAYPWLDRMIAEERKDEYSKTHAKKLPDASIPEWLGQDIIDNWNVDVPGWDMYMVMSVQTRMTSDESESKHINVQLRMESKEDFEFSVDVDKWQNGVNLDGAPSMRNYKDGKPDESLHSIEKHVEHEPVRLMLEWDDRFRTITIYSYGWYKDMNSQDLRNKKRWYKAWNRLWCSECDGKMSMQEHVDVLLDGVLYVGKDVDYPSIGNMKCESLTNMSNYKTIKYNDVHDRR